MSNIVEGIISGLLFGAFSAIITKAYAPIIGFGVIGGAIVGWILG